MRDFLSLQALFSLCTTVKRSHNHKTDEIRCPISLPILWRCSFLVPLFVSCFVCLFVCLVSFLVAWCVASVFALFDVARCGELTSQRSNSKKKEKHLKRKEAKEGRPKHTHTSNKTHQIQHNKGKKNTTHPRKDTEVRHRETRVGLRVPCHCSHCGVDLFVVRWLTWLRSIAVTSGTRATKNMRGTQSHKGKATVWAAVCLVRAGWWLVCSFLLFVLHLLSSVSTLHCPPSCQSPVSHRR